MKFRVALASIWLVLALACGGSPPARYSANLSAPWIEMGLPIGAGIITQSSPSMLLVDYEYEGASVAEIAQSWSQAITTTGWGEAANQSNSGVASYVFQRDGQSLSFAATETLGVVTIALQPLE